MIDNYDSFTYNLVQGFASEGAEVKVVRNDAASVESLLASGADGLVISPGPGTPDDAGISKEALRCFAEAGIPVFGVCLGHQALASVYGGKVVRAPDIMHGKTSAIRHHGEGLYRGLPECFEATRYHSLVVEPASCPQELVRTAWTDTGEIMGLQHKRLPVEGVQFHPESILTPHGAAILGNFVRRCRTGRGQ
ncbi:MAG: aminodeoxychorismate/anthranilate synthase component II [Myxococcota bacterium]|nr:aminodeoxychorismate/anthranilate synthase component II [Myxococcota bacterium]